MVHGYRPKRAPESVKDCLTRFHNEPLTESVLKRSTVSSRKVPSYEELPRTAPYGMTTDSLNRKGANKFCDNSKVDELMAPKSSDMNNLSAEDLKLPRPKAEVL